MSYVMAFLVGGSICALGQSLFDRTRLTMAHVMVLYVVLGAVLTGVGLYEPLVRVGGAGATVPVSNFGYVLTLGVVDKLEEIGVFGMLTGVFQLAGGALAAAIVFGFAFALIFHPKG